MKNRTDELLDDVLLEAPARKASLRVVRGAARRRRWNRRLQQGTLVALALAAGFAWLRPSRTVERTASPSEASYVIRTRALPSGFIVQTQEKSVTMVTTLGTSVEFFSTVSAPAPERIDDETLLQLAPRAILVRHPTGPPQLVFPATSDGELESRAVSPAP